MNSQRFQPRSSLTSGAFHGRAQFSPLLRRTAQTALTRNRVQAQLSKLGSNVVPAAEALTPETPVLSHRWWNPHVVDRLQFELSRVRD